MSVGRLYYVLIVYSLMEHVTWKSPGLMCGWVGRILHPDSCMHFSVFLIQSASFSHLVCRYASLSTTFALCQSMSWFSSTAWSVMADLWVILLSLTLEARVCVPAVAVVDREAQRRTRWIKEALWIRKTPTCINLIILLQELKYTNHMSLSVK